MSHSSGCRTRRDRARQAGFSLVEVMIVTAIMGVVTGIAVLTISSSRQGLIGDGAMRVVLAQMNQAKELAITQRRNMRLTFTGNNSVQIVREEVPGPTLTTLSSVPFENRLQYLRPAGVPDLTNPGNAPTLNELAAVASPSLSTSTAVAFGNGTTQIRFAPDGTLVDQDGNTVNGTVFVALTNQTLSTRAIAIFGSTGRIRAYRWDGRNWKPV
jgi:prepilin-type N-terminal cleavage/methylation domain-containing protein